MQQRSKKWRAQRDSPTEAKRGRVLREREAPSVSLLATARKQC
jgi:hypothetical protein